MDKKKYYINLFKISAAWNFLIGFGISFILLLNLDVWDLFGVLRPPSLVWILGYLIFVGVLGIGYYSVSLNLDENHYSIVMGIVAKLYVFVSNLYFLIQDEVGIMVFLLGVGDLVFTGLFIEFFVNYKKEK